VLERPHRVAGASLLAVGAAAAIALGGCGSSHARSGAETVAQVSERDFHISAPSHLHAGRVLLRVTNEGPDRHELIIVPSSAAALPLRSDGFTVDEEAVEAKEPGSLEPGRSGSVRELSVDLAPGRYVFFCNMEGHFMGGMHTEVQVN
jgi:uncharacterized cupredoxin-like copper-binding protein